MRNLIPQAERTLADCVRRLDKDICNEVIKSLQAGILPAGTIRQAYTALVGRIQTQSRFGK